VVGVGGRYGERGSVSPRSYYEEIDRPERERAEFHTRNSAVSPWE
jgi:hypothetical protein